VDAGYYQASSFGDEQTDAFVLNGSLGILDNWHAQLSYIDGSLADSGFADSNDFDGYNIVVGAHPAINEKSQLVVNAMYFDTSYEASGFGGNDIDRDGYGFGVGVRTNVTDKVEASAIAYWSDASFDEDFSTSDTDATEVSIIFSGRYNWTPSISTGAAINISDPVVGGSENSMLLDVRWTFGGVTALGPNSVFGAMSD
jgi:hypothetical protein